MSKITRKKYRGSVKTRSAKNIRLQREMILLSSSEEATVQNDTNRKSRRRYIRLDDKNSALPGTQKLEINI